MSDTLLFLHLLSAFILVAAIAMTSAFVLGAPVDRRALGVAGVLSAIGGVGVLIFGIWLAIDIKGYEVWDGWVIAAIVLWAVAFGLSSQPDKALKDAAGEEPGGVSVPAKAARFHWIAVTLIVALLIVMVWKPGA